MPQLFETRLEMAADVTGVSLQVFVPDDVEHPADLRGVAVSLLHGDDPLGDLVEPLPEPGRDAGMVLQEEVQRPDRRGASDGRSSTGTPPVTLPAGFFVKLAPRSVERWLEMLPKTRLV